MKHNAGKIKHSDCFQNKVEIIRRGDPLRSEYILKLNGKVIIDCAATDPMASKYLTIKAAENLAKALNVSLDDK